MRTVKQAGTQIVVGVVVLADQPFGAVGVGKHPCTEAFLDELLFFAGGKCFFLVDHAFLAIAVVDGVINGRCLHVEGQFQQPCAVGAGGAELGRGTHRHLGGVSGFHTPHGIFFQVGDRNVRWLDAEKVAGKCSDVLCWYPQEPPRFASMSPGSTSSGCTLCSASTFRA